MNVGRTFRKLAKLAAVAVAVLPSLVQAFIPLHEADGSVHARLAAPTAGQGLRLERGHSCPRHNGGWKTPAPLVHAIVDNQGDIVNRYAYDSFGVIDWDYSYETVPNRYTFQGREYDHERGDYYFRNRVYVPEWGLFSGPDMNLAAGPYGEPHGLMSYVFCGNDPWRYADPMGLDSMMNSVSMDLATGRTVAGSDVAEIASWALSPSHVYTENALYPFGLAGHAALSPALGSLERFNARRDYYDSFWLSLNHSLNPMVQCVVSGGEAGTGMGMQYGNSGVNLTQGECWMAGGRSVLALGESAFIASAAVSSTAGQFVTSAIETGSRSQARILLEINRAVTGRVAWGSVEEAAIRGGRPLVAKMVSLSDNGYGVSFFDSKIASVLDDMNATLGRTGEAHFFMMIEDAVEIRTAAEAARKTGMAPSVMKAYLTDESVYGIAFPLRDVSYKVPTAIDAAGWPHYFEGGRTAVRTGIENGGYLLNTTREFVVPGGGMMPSKSVLFKMEPSGAWTSIRNY